MGRRVVQHAAFLSRHPRSAKCLWAHHPRPNDASPSRSNLLGSRPQPLGKSWWQLRDLGPEHHQVHCTRDRVAVHSRSPDRGSIGNKVHNRVAPWLRGRTQPHNQGRPGSIRQGHRQSANCTGIGKQCCMYRNFRATAHYRHSRFRYDSNFAWHIDRIERFAKTAPDGGQSADSLKCHHLDVRGQSDPSDHEPAAHPLYRQSADASTQLSYFINSFSQLDRCLH